MVDFTQTENQPDLLPLVTVAMPVYNAGIYLRLAVLSIVKQTFVNWELLIIDDGSTDSALQSIADIQDVRIQVLRDGKNQGLAARLNECIDLARGKYFARMDQDDVSYPERLMQQIEFFNQNPELDLLAVRAITIDEHNKAVGIFPGAITNDEICARPWQGFYFPHPTWMGKIEWFRKYRYTEPAPFFCEDQELLLRSYRESRLATVDKILLAYRIRRQIDWKKLAKTRRTIFFAQLQCFTRLKLWCFVLLATAAFITKMGSDLWKKITRNNFQIGTDSMDNTIMMDWHKVFEELVTEIKAS